MEIDQSNAYIMWMLSVSVYLLHMLCLHICFSLFSMSSMLLIDILWFQNLRIYFTASPETSHRALSAIFSNAFSEFAEMSRRIESGTEAFFTLVSVLGAGTSATSMDNILTCELFASKFQWKLFFVSSLAMYIFMGAKLIVTPLILLDTHTRTHTHTPHHICGILS